ncbi:TonB-dependent receptor [Paraburkholderia sp. DHOC27]|uniref:TonB-dependent receptor n=1 Tax=Paraburkholderia sp. DHOC27 TaxID=2303330 RepID=UPI000E3DB75E|nr:TonB-dependent receptor [Paraburkholderia sp. DHOC27]RFU48141.1 TonB-dependent receptor [Paraburkholderia sp. DHOC27]
MKQRALALAIRRIIWAELALTTAIAVPAFAQSQPATPAAAATGTAAAAAPDAASGAAATGANKNVKQLKTFQVTGSLIRQADKVGFNQVQTVSQKDIQDSGSTTVADFLRQTSANSANSWSEGQTSNFAAGAAGIALRGLSEKYTLVLLDGQRVAPFAFYSNSVDSFFDLNTLPLNDIDRIEIVKTGAVSQYGSDAVAGVVNVITKHDFQGLQLDGSVGSSVSDGAGNGTYKFGVLGGFGDLNSDRYNITIAASAYKDNGSTLADRDSTAQQDFTGKPGGFSLLAPSYWNMPDGSALSTGGCAGGGATRTATNNSIPATTGAPGTVCSYNTANDTSIAPMMERYNVKVHGDFKINDTTTAWADLLESNNRSVQNDGVPIIGNPQGAALVYNPATKLVSPFNFTVPASNPYNPFGVDTPLTYAFPHAVAETTDANYYRAATGIKGTVGLPVGGDWDWATSISHSQSTVSNTYSGQLNAAALTNIYQNGVFDFGNPAATPNGLAGLYQNANNMGISKLDTVDATISTPTLFTLPAGDVGLGFGAQFTHQSEFINPGYEYAEGTVISPNLETVNGQRNVAAVYYQIDIPIIKNLTFSQSGRYDHYSDVGGAFSPRFALRYQPVSALTMYTSYSRGFRAPTFVEDSASRTIGIQVDQATGQNYTSITEGNPNLAPERTKNLNIGFELSPTRTTDVGFDWYKIRVDNVIGQGAPSQQVTDANGNLIYAVIPYQNLGYLDTNGFEGTLRQALPTAVGTFTLAADWAYVNSFKLGSPGSAPINGAGNNYTLTQPFGGSFPRWKGNTSVDWNYHKWDAQLTWEFTGPYAQNLFPTPAPNKVGSYSQFNLMVSYSGFKHWTIYGGVDNIFNRTPPYDPIFANGPLDQSGYDTSVYNYLGVFAQIGATYKF